MTLFGNGVVHAAEEASCTQQLPGSGQRPLVACLPPGRCACSPDTWVLRLSAFLMGWFSLL